MTGGGPSRTVPSRGRTAAGRGPGTGRRPPQQAEALGTARGPAWGFGGGTRPEPGEAGGSRGAGSWAGARPRQINADFSL